MKEFLFHHLPFKNGKIEIPSQVRRVKLDIGLSTTAPMSQNWLSHEDHLLVFGFEPNPTSIHNITTGVNVCNCPLHTGRVYDDALDLKYIGERFFLVPCALGLSRQENVTFYVTKRDCGCSSIFVPKDFEVERVIEVPMFPLSDFFDLFPFEEIPLIDHIKIDAQAADLEIVKSAGSYLERVVFLTLEPDYNQYENGAHTILEMVEHLKSIGFAHCAAQTEDPTFVNLRLLDYAKLANIRLYQKG